MIKDLKLSFTRKLRTRNYKLLHFDIQSSGIHDSLLILLLSNDVDVGQQWAE